MCIVNFISRFIANNIAKKIMSEPLIREQIKNVQESMKKMPSIIAAREELYKKRNKDIIP